MELFLELDRVTDQNDMMKMILRTMMISRMIKAKMMRQQRKKRKLFQMITTLTFQSQIWEWTTHQIPSLSLVIYKELQYNLLTCIVTLPKIEINVINIKSDLPLYFDTPFSSPFNYLYSTSNCKSSIQLQDT